MIRTLLILALWPSALLAQMPEGSGTRWLPFRALTGQWEGTGTGVWGSSKVEANCHFILNDRFLEFRTKAVYPAAETDSGGSGSK